MINKNFALILLLGALLPLGACASTRQCPPNEPIFKFKEVPKPYPVIVKFEVLPPLVLPEYPMHPGHDADEAEMKSWALDVKDVASQRDALQAARIKALEEQIAAHNRFEVVVPPE